MYMNARGLRVDEDGMAATKEKLEAEIAQLTAELEEVAEWPH